MAIGRFFGYGWTDGNNVSEKIKMMANAIMGDANTSLFLNMFAPPLFLKINDNVLLFLLHSNYNLGTSIYSISNNRSCVG
jgi:hypothetical protein